MKQIMEKVHKMDVFKDTAIIFTLKKNNNGILMQKGNATVHEDKYIQKIAWTDAILASTI